MHPIRMETPEQLVERFSRAYRAKRFEDVYEMYSESSEIRRGIDKKHYVSKMRSAVLRTKMEILEAKVASSSAQGDVAKVTLLSTTKSIVGQWHVEEEFILKREGSEWRIASTTKVRQWPAGGRNASGVRGRM